MTRCKTSKKRRYSLIPLVEGKEVTMGRGLDVTVQLLSKKRDSLILLSRKHAVFKESDDGKWTVTDNKSLNGVYLNDVRLKPCTPFPIEEGDIIQIGAIPERETEAEFVFQVVKEDLSVAKANEILSSLNPSNVVKRKDSQHTQPAKVSQAQCDSKSKSDCDVSSIVSKRKRDEEQNSSRIFQGVERQHEFGEPSSSHAANKRTRVDDNKHKNLGLSDEEGQILNAILSKRSKHSVQEILQMIQSKSLSPHKKKEENELKLKLEEQERLLKAKEEEMRRITEDLKAKAQEKENCLLEQLEKQKEELLSEKMKVEREMKAMAESLEAKELTLMEQLTKQREELLAERQNVEKTLQENLAKQLAEKDENFNKEQEKLRKELEERIKQKDEEMLAEIEAQKSALLAEKQTVEESLQSEVAKNLEQKKLLEEEKKRLESVIANKEQEYTSMQEMLEEGQKARKEEEELKIAEAKKEAFENITDVLESELQCSICAELFIQATTLSCSHSFCNYCITEWMKRKKECPVCRAPIKSHSLSIVLDNYIDKMVENLGDDVKQRRKEMLEDRRKTQGDNKVPVVPVVISDGDEEDDDDVDVDHISSDSNDDEDSTYEDGIPGAYFGGYGRCYNCGARGHWANGCPY